MKIEAKILDKAYKSRDIAVTQTSHAATCSYVVHRYLASSMVAGLVVTTAMNPLDVISTRLYTQGTGVTERYTGPLDCAMKTTRAEGFRGVSGPCGGSATAHACEKWRLYVVVVAVVLTLLRLLLPPLALALVQYFRQAPSFLLFFVSSLIPPSSPLQRRGDQLAAVSTDIVPPTPPCARGPARVFLFSAVQGLDAALLQARGELLLLPSMLLRWWPELMQMKNTKALLFCVCSSRTRRPPYPGLIASNRFALTPWSPSPASVHPITRRRLRSFTA